MFGSEVNRRGGGLPTSSVDGVVGRVNSLPVQMAQLAVQHEQIRRPPNKRMPQTEWAVGSFRAINGDRAHHGGHASPFVLRKYRAT